MNPIVRNVLDNSLLIGTQDKPVQCCFFEGAERLLTVTGDNAAGKSIFRRALGQFSRKAGLDVLHFSPEGKSQGGMVGSMIYGSEEDGSTGYNSARTILKAFETSSSRERDHIIIFDEPDTGLSDEYAAGVGVAIREFFQSEIARAKLTVIISHRRCLMQELREINPSHLSVGSNMSLDEWIGRQVVPKKLEHLKQANSHMYSLIARARNSANRAGERDAVMTSDLWSTGEWES